MSEVRKRTFSARLLGAARLGIATYEEVEADTNANGQALVVVLLAALAAGIGSFANGGIGGGSWGARWRP